jgi:hypothetical protein
MNKKQTVVITSITSLFLLGSLLTVGPKFPRLFSEFTQATVGLLLLLSAFSLCAWSFTWPLTKNEPLSCPVANLALGSQWADITDKEQKSFVTAMSAVQREVHRVNRENGWWEEREVMIRVFTEATGKSYHPHLIIELIGLGHTELSEGVEAARKHPPHTWADHTKKDTLGRELGGTVVRIMDLCEFYGINLAECILAENEHNATRGFKHGGRAA